MIEKLFEISYSPVIVAEKESYASVQPRSYLSPR